MEILKSNAFLIILFVISLASLIGVIALIISTKKQSERYKKMLEKLGNGKNIENDIMAYVEKVESVSKQNDEIINYCQNIDNNIRNCIQKIGMVRYNAFRDTGSDLSFSLALLNEHNDGVVLNGIYARDMSNIYAKPIEGGKSKYALSDEEKQAIEIAMQK